MDGTLAAALAAIGAYGMLSLALVAEVIAVFVARPGVAGAIAFNSAEPPEPFGPVALRFRCGWPGDRYTLCDAASRQPYSPSGPRPSWTR